jgi:iron complex outermembrane receptor protein
MNEHNNSISMRVIAAAIMAMPCTAVIADDALTLPAVVVRAASSVAETKQLPVTTESVTAARLAESSNVTTTEDALKYFPSVLVRKRYIGDTQAPMSTRTTGINASARSLIFADGVLLSALINNNNGNGSPQWFMVAPEEIERIDVMYGPFSAAYAGNSYGAVTVITTRMPQKFEASAKLNTVWEDFSQYGTHDTFKAQTLSATLGARSGDLSWWFSFNHLDSRSQPVTYATIAQSTTPAGGALPVVTGAYADSNRTGSPIQVIGAGNLTHTRQDTAKLKFAYDITAELAAAYNIGLWQNQADTSSQSYLSNAAGTSYYGAASGNVNIGGYSYSASTLASLFSSSKVEQEHLMQSLSLKSNTKGNWDWEAVASNFNYDKDITRATSAGVYGGTNAGRITDAGGTGWTTGDVTGVWRPQGTKGAHALSFGTHYDQYKLVSPVYNTTDWLTGGTGMRFSDSRGKTETKALWLQDVSRLGSDFKATLGGRYEEWTARSGFNYSLSGSTGFPVNQPTVEKSGFSPKASLTWAASDRWLVTGSMGKALRFPTVGELYQNVQTGSTFTQANPFLKPERVVSGELAFEHLVAEGRQRLSLFEERVADSLISQTSSIPGFATPVSYTQNVDKTRQRGVELVVEQGNVLVKGLELTGSVTYVDAKILANSSYVPTVAGATSVGKHTPYVPDWRATAVATYHVDDKWALTLAGRYSGKMYATVDNTDTNGHTYQGFERFFVMDTRVHYQFDKQWSSAIGVDNLNNRKYFLFHPFPQRTVYAELKYAL